MLMLISPAKTLDLDTPYQLPHHTDPELLPQAAELVAVLRQKTPAELAELMQISDKLAYLNFTRYHDWQIPQPQDTRAALYTFMGDVYEGLDAASLDSAGQLFAQRHLRILSGLYGVLRPFDRMQAYRLEMGTRLLNPRGKNLYQFWGERISTTLHHTLTEMGSQQLINLASEEYFKSVTANPAFHIITPVFEEQKNGGYKVIAIHAKRARGLMVRFAIDHRIQKPEQLKQFDREGYRFTAEASDTDRWVFRR